MEFFSPTSNVNFMGVRRFSVAISLVLVLGSILALATRGLNFALDFTGGTLVEVNYDQPMEQPTVVKALEAAGFRGAVVQRFDSSNFAIRLAPEAGAKDDAGALDAQDTSLDSRNAALGQRVVNALRADGVGVTVKRSEFVGPQVGKELAYNGVIAVFVVLAGIMIYIAMRFEWKFAVAVVAGEMHDVIITLGFFAVTGMDFDLTVLAAILAVDGYSVNDKIVVFDRVRELFRSTRGIEPTEVLNRAINNTLGRTIMTSLTTLLTVVSLYLFGGQTLEGFSLALIVGIVVGTLSSIFFACPVLLKLGVTKQDLMPKARDDSELARRP
ncbi:MAG: protein translocase subunit SecF [Xanthomonadaceae bacterium]|nr:protein translocase subunit SecF [Xanthomonadaceae bacterium]MDP2185765.1 protein translocase subunit SecF [Xanthomonadales bacterium]MDZ4115049.1 protein translocase subunit SecF [Xanthomonadaceae bacterium]MDZ4376827.1 protein translocase subunit SecF [Xanthomonadaceae bacterium]